MAISSRDVTGKRVNPLNTKANKALIFSHSLTHSKNYQLKVGINNARRDHNVIARKMVNRGFNHDSPFRAVVTDAQVKAYKKAHTKRRRRR